MEKGSITFYQRFLDSGNRYLQSDKLKDAERLFASAVKQVYLLKNTVYETAVALKGLGLVYKARGKIYKSGEDLVKASGLFNASLTRLRECNSENTGSRNTRRRNVKVDLESEILCLEEEISNIHTVFIEEILESQQNGRMNDFRKREHYKQSLQTIRDSCQSKMSALDEMPTLNPDVRDTTVERGRIEQTRQLYKCISKSMKVLVTSMVEDCIQVMSNPPCKFSILGLGSTAREEATPYSDLEFCILVERNEDSVLKYFNDFTNLLHLKVVELGETILPSLGIKSLNDYYSTSKEDDWFYDDGPRGFSFDGAMPWASKTPKGRDETVNKPWVQSLIKTPKDMAGLLTKKSILKEGYHLADVLSTCSLICGDSPLFEAYRRSLKDCLNETSENCTSDESWKDKVLQELIIVNKKYHNFLADYIRRPGESYKVKTDIYKFPSLVIQYVGKYFDVQCPSSWEIIEKLASATILSSEGAHNLRTVLGIAAELRLSAYLSNHSQSEYFSVLFQDRPGNLLSLLHRFFFTVIPLEEAMDKLGDKSLLDVMNSEFYNNNKKVKARICLQFMKYDEAEKILKDNLKKILKDNLDALPSTAEEQEFADIFKMLGNALYFQEKFSEASDFFERALEINKQILQQDRQSSVNQENLAKSYSNYSNVLYELGDMEKALSYADKALEIRHSLVNENPASINRVTYLQDLADAHLNIAVILSQPKSTQYPTAVIRARVRINHHCLHAQELADTLAKNHNTAYDNYRSLLAIRYLPLCHTGKWEKFIKLLDDGLETLHKHRKYDIFTYKEAELLEFLGHFAIETRDWKKARFLCNRAYEIRTRIHEGKDHDSLAKLLDNLGLVCESEYEVEHDFLKFAEALEFYTEAKDMSIRIYGDDSDNEYVQKCKRNCLRASTNFARCYSFVKLAFQLRYGTDLEVEIMNCISGKTSSFAEK